MQLFPKITAPRKKIKAKVSTPKEYLFEESSCSESYHWKNY